MYAEKRNYNLLLEELQRKIHEKTSFVAALLDIDRLFQILPELTLDERMERLRTTLEKHIRSPLLYLGRDEFAVLYEQKPLEEALVILHEAKNALKNSLQATFSAGIVDYPKAAKHPDELLRKLEEALYQAKEQGRDRICISSETKMKLKSNYYTSTQLDRLAALSQQLGRSEASLLREALDMLLRKYE